MVWLREKKFVLIGGRHTDLNMEQSFSSDVYLLDLETDTWTQIGSVCKRVLCRFDNTGATDEFTGVAPRDRYGHALARLSDTRVALFGGLVFDQYLNDGPQNDCFVFRFCSFFFFFSR